MESGSKRQAEIELRGRWQMDVTYFSMYFVQIFAANRVSTEDPSDNSRRSVLGQPALAFLAGHFSQEFLMSVFVR
jgi:hypothetical protein